MSTVKDSISGNTSLHSEGAIHVPYRLGSPQSVALDDSLASVGENPAMGIALINPEQEIAAPRNPGNSSSTSWLLIALFGIFSIIAFRFHNNKKYITALGRDLTEVRVRHNMFDDTVKETFLLFLLNIQWVFSVAVILLYGVRFIIPEYSPTYSIDLSATSDMRCYLLCLAAAIGYQTVMTGIYYVVGNVFSDSKFTSIWLKGFYASQAVAGVTFFFIALLLICYPLAAKSLCIAALILFIIAKLFFIWKGFRIFFTKSLSWILFLYYLCSLEIIPPILTFISAMLLCINFG